MTHLRARSTLLSLFAALLTVFLVLAGCGSEDVEQPVDAGPGDVDDDFTDVDDGPDDTDGPDPDADPTDTDPSDVGDTDVTEPDPPPEGTVICDNPIPEPPAGERCHVDVGTSDHILLRGTILSGDAVYEEGTLLIGDQSPNRSIECVGCDCADEPAAQDATVVSCPQGVISPGLINPHDHLTFAEGWPQLHGEERFNHRHDWRRGERGHSEINTSPRTGGHREVVLFGELRMLFGGSTSIAGSVGQTDASGLLRNLDHSNYTEGLQTIDVDYRTFPLGDSFPVFLDSGCNYPNIDNESRVENSGIYLPHIAEGIDNEARNELLCLAGDSGSNLIRENTSIIHGIAVNARDVALIADRGANLVWSPRTNIDLYGNTAPVPLYKRFGVPISLGTDWSTSGSMNMLRELECADYLNRMHFNETFTDAELWKMATYNGAISMGAEHKLGILYEDFIADITIFDGEDRAPYRAVIDADIDDIALVMRGGEPLYGDAELVAQLRDADEAEQCEIIDVCDRQRRACIELDTGQTLSEIESEIHPNAYPLFFCDEPEDEPSCVPFRPSEYDGIIGASDSSGDGIPDEMDNCPDYFNPIRPMDGNTQSDINGTGMGDVCDPCPLSEDLSCTQVDPNDWSGDGVPNDEDNCPFHYNPDQDDTSNDGVGDVCSPCPDHEIIPGSPCPHTIYDVKTGEVTDGSPLAIDDALVTGVLPGEGLFVQVHPDDEDYEGVEHSGLYVYLANVSGLEDDDYPVAGDRIRVVGSVSDFFDQLQVANVVELEILSSGHDLPEPLLVDPEEVATGGDRQVELESVLIEIHDALVTDIDVAPGPGDSAPTHEFIVDDSLHINNFFYLVDPFPALDDTFESITGVLRWANGNSKLEPRSDDDIVAGPPALTALEPDMVFLEVADDFEPALEVYLDRPAAEPVSVALDYSDSSVVDGPDSVDIATGEASAVIELRALEADPDPVIVEASMDGLTVSATVHTYDEDTERVLESFGANTNAALTGNTLTFEAILNAPAGSDGEMITLEITPDSDATYPSETTLDAGDFIAEIDVELGDDTGQFVAFATLGETTKSFPFEVFDEPEVYVETFSNFEASANSYEDGSFVGDFDFTWHYTDARRAPASGADAIDERSLIFRDSGDRSLRADDVPGGISSFSIDMMQAFTGSGVRQLELFINGESMGTSTPFGTDSADAGQVFEFSVDDIGVSGDFDIEVRSIGDRQITIDNLTWTSGLPVSSDEIEFTDADIDRFSPNSTFLEVTDSAEPVMTLELAGPALAQTAVAISYSDTDAVEGPDELVFEPGDTSADLELRGLETRPGPIQIEATHEGNTAIGHVRVDEIAREIESLHACQSSLLGHTLSFTVELSEAAGDDGFQLPIAIEPQGHVASAPETIDFAAQESSAEFSLTFDQSTGAVDISADTGTDSSTQTVDVVDLETPVVENFETFPTTGGSYTEGDFVGQQEIDWSFSGARHVSDTNTYTIDGPAMMFGSDAPSYLRTESLPGGISSFELQMRKAFTGSGERQLELLVNGDSLGTSEIFGDFSGEDDEVRTFEIDDIDIACVDSLELRSVHTDSQVTIDNVSWSPADL